MLARAPAAHVSETTADGGFADLKKALDVELGAFRCSNGQFHDTKTKKCGPTMLHLKVRPSSRLAHPHNGMHARARVPGVNPDGRGCGVRAHDDDNADDIGVACMPVLHLNV